MWDSRHIVFGAREWGGVGYGWKGGGERLGYMKERGVDWFWGGGSGGSVKMFAVTLFRCDLRQCHCYAVDDEEEML